MSSQDDPTDQEGGASLPSQSQGATPSAIQMNPYFAMYANAMSNQLPSYGQMYQQGQGVPSAGTPGGAAAAAAAASNPNAMSMYLQQMAYLLSLQQAQALAAQQRTTAVPHATATTATAPTAAGANFPPTETSAAGSGAGEKEGIQSSTQGDSSMISYDQLSSRLMMLPAQPTPSTVGGGGATLPPASAIFSTPTVTQPYRSTQQPSATTPGTPMTPSASSASKRTRRSKERIPFSWPPTVPAGWTPGSEDLPWALATKLVLHEIQRPMYSNEIIDEIYARKYRSPPTNPEEDVSRKFSSCLVHERRWWGDEGQLIVWKKDTSGANQWGLKEFLQKGMRSSVVTSTEGSESGQASGSGEASCTPLLEAIEKVLTTRDRFVKLWDMLDEFDRLRIKVQVPSDRQPVDWILKSVEKDIADKKEASTFVISGVEKSIMFGLREWNNDENSTKKRKRSRTSTVRRPRKSETSGGSGASHSASSVYGGRPEDYTKWLFPPQVTPEAIVNLRAFLIKNIELYLRTDDISRTTPEKAQYQATVLLLTQTLVVCQHVLNSLSPTGTTFISDPATAAAAAALTINSRFPSMPRTEPEPAPVSNNLSEFSQIVTATEQSPAGSSEKAPEMPQLSLAPYVQGLLAGIPHITQPELETLDKRIKEQIDGVLAQVDKSSEENFYLQMRGVCLAAFNAAFGTTTTDSFIQLLKHEEAPRNPFALLFSVLDPNGHSLPYPMAALAPLPPYLHAIAPQKLEGCTTWTPAAKIVLSEHMRPMNESEILNVLQASGWKQQQQSSPSLHESLVMGANVLGICGVASAAALVATSGQPTVWVNVENVPAGLERMPNGYYDIAQLTLALLLQRHQLMEVDKVFSLPVFQQQPFAVGASSSGQAPATRRQTAAKPKTRRSSALSSSEEEDGNWSQSEEETEERTTPKRAKKEPAGVIPAPIQPPQDQQQQSGLPDLHLSAPSSSMQEENTQPPASASSVQMSMSMITSPEASRQEIFTVVLAGNPEKCEAIDITGQEDVAVIEKIVKVVLSIPQDQGILLRKADNGHAVAIHPHMSGQYIVHPL